LKDLQEDFMNGAELRISEPVVSFCETVQAETNRTALAKSPNGHNRFWCKAAPMEEAFNVECDKGAIPKMEMKDRARTMADNFGFDVLEARKIWGFGPNGVGPNILIDATKAVQYLNEIKDSVVSAFEWVTREGVLCDEAMRGVLIRILDVTLHTDAIHRGGGQVIPAARRVFYATQMMSEPRLMEPIYLVEIMCPQVAVGGVYSCLNQRRGTVVEEIPRPGTPLYNIRAYLPVLESFGFTAHLRSLTGGQAFPQSSFDHWEVVKSNPLEAGSKARELVMAVRKRKNLSPADDLPPLDRFLDKL